MGSGLPSSLSTLNGPPTPSPIPCRSTAVELLSRAPTEDSFLCSFPRVCCVGRGEKEDRLAYHHLFCLFNVAYFNSLMHIVNTLDRLLVLFMVVWITLVLMLRDILIPNECFCLIYSEHEQFFSESSKKFFLLPNRSLVKKYCPKRSKEDEPRWVKLQTFACSNDF